MISQKINFKIFGEKIFQELCSPYIRIVDSDFPRNSNGKIDRKKITENYGN